MKKKLFILSVIFFTLFLAKKLHLQNFWKGKRELNLLTREKFFIDPKFDVFSDFIYIAHAGGGYDNKPYLNNLEAIDNSYRLGVNFIELDFNYTSDFEMVLSHDFVDKKKEDFILDKTLGTHLSLRDLMEWLTSKEIYLITDIKADNIKTLQLVASQYPELTEKIIPQAYTISDIIEIKKLGFERIIFTNYVSNYPNSIIRDLADAKILFAITMPYDINFKMLKYFTGFKIPTQFLTHTVNDAAIAAELRMSGCYGIYTDFLLFPSVH